MEPDSPRLNDARILAASMAYDLTYAVLSEKRANSLYVGSLLDDLKNEIDALNSNDSLGEDKTLCMSNASIYTNDAKISLKHPEVKQETNVNYHICEQESAISMSENCSGTFHQQQCYDFLSHTTLPRCFSSIEYINSASMNTRNSLPTLSTSKSAFDLFDYGLERINGGRDSNARSVEARSEHTGSYRQLVPPRCLKYCGVKLLRQGDRRKNSEYGKYVAYIMDKGNFINLGEFNTSLEAAMVHDKYARKLYGRYASLNYPTNNEASSLNRLIESFESLGIEYVQDNATVDDDEETSVLNWCSFCQGDPRVLFCLYCCCTNCHGKYDADCVLLCDKCDSESHMKCLDPPLKEVPKGEWYCKKCSDHEKNSQSSKNLNKKNLNTSPKSQFFDSFNQSGKPIFERPFTPLALPPRQPYENIKIELNEPKNKLKYSKIKKSQKSLLKNEKCHDGKNSNSGKRKRDPNGATTKTKGAKNSTDISAALCTIKELRKRLLTDDEICFLDKTVLCASKRDINALDKAMNLVRNRLSQQIMNLQGKIRLMSEMDSDFELSVHTETPKYHEDLILRLPRAPHFNKEVVVGVSTEKIAH